ncbi:PREDICTED: fatty-acid amide hydrolase 2-A [Drosophila arizonae]|uniref:Fatty-acid amide hydrolase 2-A n=1 Tax=Drosophila arizonae TaxID=7263 RepID=A0ABM1NN23_DROAR|nr:PREDICTED: fatty-acid amide hydrolase 2-A [Drosophila arizonae]
MELIPRLLLIFVKFVAIFASTLQSAYIWACGRRIRSYGLPANINPLLALSIQELRTRLCRRQITAVDLVDAYIDRIKLVNSRLNAVVSERFAQALRDAANVDERIAAAGENVAQLFEKQPLLGLPVTVKESCALANMSFTVGSLARSEQKATADGVVVARIRAAGAIPLLVSATPEYCYSTDTDTLLNGRCVNPFDFERTPGGSSGGEGALIGAGASLFGIGSDIGGSIRIPSFFCGIFGHKPTGGVVTPAGHFPDSSDADFQQYLVVGPMSRFAVDLPQLLELMAGEQAVQLRLHEPLQLNQLQVHYALGFQGLNGWMHQQVEPEIKASILKAVQHLQKQEVPVHQAKLSGFDNSLEIALGGIARLRQMPFLLDAGPAAGAESKVRETLKQLVQSLYGKSCYTTNALIFDLMRRCNAFMSVQKLEKYQREALALTRELTQLLGENGVLLFPTMHAPAPKHGWTPLQLWGVDYTLLFNVLGLPATHVPMGLNGKGLPIGFSVVAAPYQDRLCLRVAVELERAFGGWQSPNAKKT